MSEPDPHALARDGLDDLLRRRSLLVCVGPGGVGKTTVAAALGLQAARMGRRTLVLTIDPARRLAAMLGLDGLDDAVRRVPTEALDPSGGVRLDAAMLDTGTSYDALIHRIAADPDHRARILGNRLYRVMSRSFGAAHAYVAMERLYDVLEAGEHDLVVLDTPPTRNALDILDAPGRLANFLEEGVLKWFVPGPGGGLRGRLFARGGASVTRLLGRIAGDALVRELGEFLSVFMSLRGGFQRRAGHVQRVLRADSSAFVLVSSATVPNLVDAQFLHDGLVGRGISVRAAVFNRAYTILDDDPRVVVTDAAPRADIHLAALAAVRRAVCEAGDAGLDAGVDHRQRAEATRRAPAGETRQALGGEPRRAPDELDGETRRAPDELDRETRGVLDELDRETRRVLAELDALRAATAAENRAGQRAVAAFADRLDRTCLKVQVPSFERELRDLPALARLGEHLCVATPDDAPAGSGADHPTRR